MPSGNEMRKRQ